MGRGWGSTISIRLHLQESGTNVFKYTIWAKKFDFFVNKQRRMQYILNFAFQVSRVPHPSTIATTGNFTEQA